MNDDKALIVQRVVPAFLDQRGDFRVQKKEFVKPGDLREHLQVGEVLRLKIFLGPFGSITAATKTLPELAVTRIADNHGKRIGLEKILQSEAALFRSKIFRWLGRYLQKRIVRGSRNVVLDLGDQRRNQVESLMYVGKFVQQLDHAVIIFEGMQANPGQTVFARDQVFVKRLMLMPEDDDAQNRH